MSEVNDLKQLIKERLIKRGFTDRIKGEVKSEILSILSEELNEDNDKRKNKLSNENLLINDLIREYLDFNRYQFTSDALLLESEQPKTIMDRKFLCDQLNVKESTNSRSLPLLYSLINCFSKLSEAKHLPALLSDQCNRNNPKQKATKDMPCAIADSESSLSTSESQNGGPISKVYSARDYLRERSSYSSSTESQ